MNPYRLTRLVVPSRYDLRLEPNLDAATFAGDEIITVTIEQPTSDITLNAAELDITDASIQDEHQRSYPGTIALDEPLERCRVTFPTTLSPGTYDLHLTFNGILNDKLRGFYRSTYQDQVGTTHVMAATQFEATDARRAFPCWDEPDFKAVFSTTLVIDPAFMAVSNTALKSERLQNGKKILEFHDTIRMSTYLVAFIVGNLEGTAPVTIGTAPLRIYSVPGKQHLASFAQDIAAFSLKFFEGYYGQPYPGDKLDLLAIPDFASGAMENLGAITFRETALLIDEQASTHSELERVADVVSHENAHMWFGDLVTMSWWNGLWLNEAFATFMEMLAVDAWQPHWDRWTTFGVSRAAALAVDGLLSTRPIEFQVHAPRDADAMFDVLTYEKGASVLRMLEQFLGAQVFRDGVRDYLRTHAYGNADTKDLWEALGRAAQQSVPSLMNEWIFKEGYPVITVELTTQSRLTITQRRFTYLPHSDTADAVTAWQVPLQIRWTTKGRVSSQQLLLTETETTLEAPEGLESVLINENGHGFYRVQYSPVLLARLLDLVPEGLKPIERFNLVNDTWAATIAGLVSIADYLDVTSRFRTDRDKNVWAILIDSFHYLNRIIPPADRPAFESFVRGRVRPVFEDLGWAPRSDETQLTRQLRGDAIRALGTVGNDPAIQSGAKDLFEDASQAPDAVDPNVFPALVAILAQVGDHKRYDEFVKRFCSAATPQEERRYLYALTTFRPAELLAQTLGKTINGEIRTQDGPFVVGAVLMNVYGREQAWEFLTHNWERMDQLFPKQGLRRMCGGIVGLATPALEREVVDFFHSRKIHLGGKTLDQYLEQLRVAVRFRERNGTHLSEYLRRCT